MAGNAAMSLINQMLQDLEKRRPQSAIGDASPVQVMAVTQHHPAKWMPLLVVAILGIGVSASVLMLRPSVSGTISAALPHTTSIAPNQPVPAQPPLSRITPDQHKPIVTMPVPATPPPTPSSIIAVPAPVIAMDQALLQMEKQQHITQIPNPSVPDNPLPDNSQETPDVPISSKHLKEITPAQQAENQYRKALELMQQGRMTRAMESLAQALQLDSSHNAARQTLAGLLVDTQRFAEAEHRLQEGLNRLDPDQPGQPGLAMMLARLQVERGNTRAGLETLQRSLPDAVEQADYQAFLAALLQREGRHGEAIEHYLQAIGKVPQSGIWLMGIGISLQAENRMQDAQEAFKHAKASNTLSPELVAFVEQRLKQIKR